MRQGIINATSPREDIVGTLTGTGDEYDKAGWRVVVTPFLTAISGTFAAGSHALPFRFSGTVQIALSYGNGGGGTLLTVKAGQQAVKFEQACFAQAVVFGDNAKPLSV